MVTEICAGGGVCAAGVGGFGGVGVGGVGLEAIRETVAEADWADGFAGCRDGDVARGRYRGRGFIHTGGIKRPASCGLTDQTMLWFVLPLTFAVNFFVSDCFRRA